jgi:hypothetical protein
MNMRSSLLNLFRIRIYEICPSSADPAFLEQGTLLFPPELRRELEQDNDRMKMVMTDGHLFVGTSAYGIIWDFIKGRYRFWFVRGRDSSEVVEVRRLAFPS